MPEVAGILHKVEDGRVGDGLRIAADAGEQGLHMALHCSSISLCFPPVGALQLQIHVRGGGHVRYRSLHHIQPVTLMLGGCPAHQKLYSASGTQGMATEALLT